MKLLMAVDLNWNIGRDNQLLFRIGPDLERFRALTEGQTIIMGRRTLESLPGSKPLAGRRNIVLTRQEGYRPEGLTVYGSREELLARLDYYQGLGQVFLIGGADLASSLLDFCQELLITRVHQLVEDADARLEDLDKNPDFVLVEESPVQVWKNFKFQYLKYRRA